MAAMSVWNLFALLLCASVCFRSIAALICVVYCRVTTLLNILASYSIVHRAVFISERGILIYSNVSGFMYLFSTNLADIYARNKYQNPGGD